MSNQDILLKAFETARAWSSLLVTLSTGGIVVTAVFRKEFVAADSVLLQPWLLLATWASLGAAALMGVLVLSVITALLSRGTPQGLNVYHPLLRLFAILQVVFFLAGLVVLLVFVSLNLQA